MGLTAPLRDKPGKCAWVGLKDTGAMTAVNSAALNFGEFHCLVMWLGS